MSIHATSPRDFLPILTFREFILVISVRLSSSTYRPSNILAANCKTAIDASLITSFVIRREDIDPLDLD